MNVVRLDPIARVRYALRSPRRPTVRAILHVVNIRLPRTRRTRLALLVSVCLVVAGAVVAAVRTDAARGPELVFGADGSASGTLGFIKAKDHESAYFGSACLNEPGRVTIRSIEPVAPRGGLRVTDFSVVPLVDTGEGTLGASSRRLRDEPSYRGGATLRAQCADDDFANVYVEVYKPRSEDAVAREFTITYDSEGRRKTAPLLYGFGLCEKDGCDASS